MGQSDGSMNEEYREGIDNSRCKPSSTSYRNWLFAAKTESPEVLPFEAMAG